MADVDPLLAALSAADDLLDALTGDPSPVDPEPTVELAAQETATAPAPVVPVRASGRFLPC